MTQTLTKYPRYEALFSALRPARNDEPAWLAELRAGGFKRFQLLGFPVERRGNEEWKYTNIKPIAEAAFEYPRGAGDAALAAITERLPFDSGMTRVVFVDGHFVEALSATATEGVTVMPLSKAIQKHEAIVQKHLGQYARASDGAFAALNAALFADGAFVLADNATRTPVHLMYATTTAGSMTYPRTLVVAGPTSELTLIETYVSLTDGNHFTDAVTEIVLEDGARVDHYRLLLENDAAYQVGQVRVSQGRDTHYGGLVYETGGGLARLDMETLFGDTGSYADLRGLYITSGDQHIDNMISIDHAKPHNTSRLIYKGILDGRSSAVFGGTVFVRPGADKTDSHQEDKNLLLSHEAEVDSKPALEIYADDVKAGHGATAGAITDEALFYLQSRGIDEFTAMQLIVRGFASQITDTVAVQSLRAWLEQHTLEALPRFRAGGAG